jgi:hypothetical protein
MTHTSPTIYNFLRHFAQQNNLDASALCEEWRKYVEELLGSPSLALPPVASKRKHADVYDNKTCSELAAKRRQANVYENKTCSELAAECVERNMPKMNKKTLKAVYIAALLKDDEPPKTPEACEDESSLKESSDFVFE